MNPLTDGLLVPLKLTPEQLQWLENTARFIENETGCKVSHRSILMRLMEHGLPLLEKDLENLRAKANAEQKRFPRLQLVYTRYESQMG